MDNSNTNDCDKSKATSKIINDRQCAKYLDEYISKILKDDKYIENLITETIENINEEERLKCRKHSYCTIS
jgi:hypothetical protein